MLTTVEIVAEFGDGRGIRVKLPLRPLGLLLGSELTSQSRSLTDDAATEKGGCVKTRG